MRNISYMNQDFSIVTSSPAEESNLFSKRYVPVSYSVTMEKALIYISDVSHMFHLFQRNLLPHIITCKRSKLKFSAAVDFFTCALFKEYWIYADTIGLDFVGVQTPARHYSLIGLDWTRFDFR